MSVRKREIVNIEALRQRLSSLGVSPTIIHTVVTKADNAFYEVDDSILEKYRQAGFKSKVKRIERSRELKNLPHLVITIRSLEYHYNVLEGHGEVLHAHIRQQTTEKRFLRTVTVTNEQVLALLPVEKYKEEAPEFILDKIIKTKKDFGYHYIGVPAIAHAQDPILFGSKTRLPQEWRGSRGPWDLYILGVWGNDWHDLDLRSLSKGGNDNR